MESAFLKHGASFASSVCESGGQDDGEENDDDDEAGEERDEEEDEHDEQPATKKRPAASHKKPAAAPTMKRPSGAPARSGAVGKKWKVLKFYRKSEAKKGEPCFVYEAPWAKHFRRSLKPGCMPASVCDCFGCK